MRGAGVIGQAVGAVSDRSQRTDPVHGLDISGRCRDNEEAQGWQGGVGRKGEIGVTGEAKAAHVGRNGFGVVELDELEVLSVRTRLRMVHDFGDDQPGPPARRAQWFDRAPNSQSDQPEESGQPEAGAPRERTTNSSANAVERRARFHDQYRRLKAE